MGVNMEVKYKTILHGDKSPSQPDAVYDYQLVEIQQYCCEDMRKAISDKAIMLNDNNPLLCFSHIWDFSESDFDYYNIKFCPFCGISIQYREVKRTYFKNAGVQTTPKYEEVDFS
jgi:hypothetical protein